MRASSMNSKLWRPKLEPIVRGLVMALGKYLNSMSHLLAGQMSRKACGSYTNGFTKIGMQPSRVP